MRIPWNELLVRHRNGAASRVLAGAERLAELYLFRAGRASPGVSLRGARDPAAMVLDPETIDWTGFPASEAMEEAALREDHRWRAEAADPAWLGGAVDLAPRSLRVAAHLAERLGRQTGDSCTVRLLSGDGAWLYPAGGYHPDPSFRSALLEGLRRSAQRSEVGLWKPVLELQAVRRLALSGQEMPLDATPSQAAFIRRHAARAVIGAPLVAHGRVVGAVSLARYGVEFEYQAGDEARIRELAHEAVRTIWGG